MKKVWNFIVIGVLAFMVLLAAVLYLPKLVGIEPLIVLSGSMEPKYPVGSLLYVQHKEPEQMKKGDVITFFIDEKTMVTHRIESVDLAKREFVTKGDANAVSDGTPVRFDCVVGTPVCAVPGLGYAADRMSHTSGKILYVTLMVTGILLLYMGEIIWSNDKENLTGRKEVRHENGKKANG